MNENNVQFSEIQKYDYLYFGDGEGSICKVDKGNYVLLKDVKHLVNEANKIYENKEKRILLVPRGEITIKETNYLLEQGIIAAEVDNPSKCVLMGQKEDRYPMCTLDGNLSHIAKSMIGTNEVGKRKSASECMTESEVYNQNVILKKENKELKELIKYSIDTSDHNQVISRVLTDRMREAVE